MTDARLLEVLDGIDPFAARADEPALSDVQRAALAALPAAEAGLLDVAGDADAMPRRRYAAAEALLQWPAPAWRPDAVGRRAVALALASAMQHDVQHNRWGLPRQFVGRLGRQLLALGAEGRLALEPLRADATPLRVVGSEAATLQAAAGWRVGDLAAWLIDSSGSDLHPS